MIDIEQLRADMAAGTEPHWWKSQLDFYLDEDGGYSDQKTADYDRIARLPDLETAYLELAEEIARLRAALKPFADIGVGTDPDYQPQIRLDRDAILAARAALGETK